VKVLRLLALGIGGLFALVVVLVAALAIHGHNLLHARAANPIPEVRVARDSAQVARGRHLSDVVCAGCHAADEPGVLSGGRENFGAIPGGPTLGRIHAPNLTPASRVGTWDDGTLARAIREGVGADGRPLLVMPSAGLRQLSDGDLAALIAYLRSQPPVATQVPERRLNLLGYLVLGTHMFETSAQLPVDRPVPGVAEAADSAYGAYLAAVTDCRACHGPDLRGGRKGQLAPIGPDLVTLARAHELGTFAAALREGQGTRGRPLDPTRMPWPMYAHLTDVEVSAIHAYLRSQPGASGAP
jgi:mono/diheme cytochrome c family protein